MPKANFGDDPRIRPRERMPPVTLDWIDGKNVKLLKVANDREAFKFKKLNVALSSLENVHKSCWLREERRVKQSLHRLTSVSPTYRSQTLFQRPSKDFRFSPVGGASRVTLPVSPQAQDSQDEAHITPSSSSCKSSTPLTPRSSQRSLNLPPFPLHPGKDSQGALSARTSSYWGGRYMTLQRPGQDPSGLSLLSQGPPSFRGGGRTPLLVTPSILALLPPELSLELQGLKEAVMGFPLLQRKVREFLACTRITEQERQAQRSLTLHPLEALHCRYLRLSESNISTLLELCRESGIHVDMHAHMKDSDIDITKLFTSFPLPASPSDSTETVTSVHTPVTAAPNL
ncbi:uncharacterized protein LOC134020545 [Osmerus eperlanus]|uniref:uncharacterized protein LOC134020545 n=1 Tax=Osmerus eperlanus TaxID=29151 RepID=UPI002E0DE4BE